MDSTITSPKLRALLEELHSLGTQDIYTDAPEYAERVQEVRTLFAQLGKTLR